MFPLLKILQWLLFAFRIRVINYGFHDCCFSFLPPLQPHSTPLASDPVAFLQFLHHPKLFPVAGPLHGLFSLPGASSPHLLHCHFFLFPSLNVTLSEMPSITTLPLLFLSQSLVYLLYNSYHN